MLYILYYLLWCAAATIAPQFIFQILLYPFFNLSQPLPHFIYSLLSYLLSFILIIFVPHKIFKQKRETREGLGIKHLPKWSDILLAPIGFVIYIIIATAVLTAINFLFHLESETQNLGLTSNLFTIGDRIFAFLTLCVAAPIAEEFIFRGWLYAKLRVKISSKVSLPISIILTSLLFAVLHGQVSVGINVFCLSIVLCGLREVTGTIYSGILLHIIKNVVAFCLIYVL